MSPELLKPLPDSSRVKKKALIVKFMVGGRGFAVRLSPVLLVLVAVCCYYGAQAAHQSYQAYQADQLERVAELEAQNRRLQTFIAHKEREKNQMIALAEARSEELWQELETRDQELEQLWKVVGKSPSVSPRRKSLEGSRAGRRDSLAVKLKYRDLYSKMKNRKGELNKLEVAAVGYRKELERKRLEAQMNATPSIWPCHGRYSSGFGYRIHPVYGYGRFHSGVDITAGYGTPIRATAAGRVVTASYMSGYGNTIEIDHGNGLRTLYGHCSSLAVGQGTFVKKGQTVAYVGSTGVSTGPHVHYEVHRYGSQVDPAPYLTRKDLPGSVAKK